MNTRVILFTLLVSVLTACGSAPVPNETLERARRDFTTAQSAAQINSLAADELRIAEQSLRVAEMAYNERDIPTNVDHLAYLSIQYTAIAREVAATRAAQAVTAGAATERERILAEARTNREAAAQRTITRTPLANTQGSSDRAAVQAQATAAQQQLARMIEESARNEAEP